jgi:hypothetical protein
MVSKSVNGKSQFTKKDVLVVIGCALFLASIVPIVSIGRRRVRETVCLSNLRKWGVAWKEYTDDHDGRFPTRGGGDPWEDTVAGWPGALESYYENANLLFCPEATKSYAEGGRCPFGTWYDYDPERDQTVESSYCANLWIANEHRSRFWKAPYVAGGSHIPIMLDGNWKHAAPLATDNPPASREWIQQSCWEARRNHMKRVCHYRHGEVVNGVFSDFSARKIGLKELWKLWWHREWPTDYPPPAWPEWMEDFKDY